MTASQSPDISKLHEYTSTIQNNTMINTGIRTTAKHTYFKVELIHQNITIWSDEWDVFKPTETNQDNFHIKTGNNEGSLNSIIDTQPAEQKLDKTLTTWDYSAAAQTETLSI